MPDDVPHARNLAARIERFLRHARGANGTCASPSRTTFTPSRPLPRCACISKISSRRNTQGAGIDDRRFGGLRGNRRTRRRTRAPLELTLLRFRTGRMGRFPTIAEATEYPYSKEERSIIEMNRDRSFVGSPATVREKLTHLADRVRRLRNHDHHDDPRPRRPPPLLRIASRSLLPLRGAEMTTRQANDLLRRALLQKRQEQLVLEQRAVSFFFGSSERGPPRGSIIPACLPANTGQRMSEVESPAFFFVGHSLALVAS